MIESDNDIEFLDEDAEIVQKCVEVQSVQPPVELVPLENDQQTPLLVERRPVENRKRRRVDEDDSDYDPSEDLSAQSPPSPPSSKVKKKKQQVLNKKTKSHQNEVVPCKPSQILANELILERKKLRIRIPDYDDALCLPVKAIKQDISDSKRLNNWNNVCLEHFKHCDSLLKPEKGETKRSTRTLVFRNVINKQSGKSDTTIWSKTSVENVEGDRKSEIFQCVLPRYRENKIVKPFKFFNPRGKHYSKHYPSDEVILSKEEYKDGEILVVYKPKESLSAAYKLIVAKDNKECNEELEEKEEANAAMFMKEIMCGKICVQCYQESWRPITKNVAKSKSCPICKRTSFMTAYNLLAHFKLHSAEDVRKHKSAISNILSQVVEYHYRCRVCRVRFDSVKKLRKHINTHQGTQMFTCEVCNRTTKNFSMNSIK